MQIISKKKAAIISSILLVLLAPLIAMQFTNDVQWSLFDFALAALLLLITVLLVKIVLRTVQKTTSRLFIFLLIFTILVMLWAELAVGIFNSPISGN